MKILLIEDNIDDINVLENTCVNAFQGRVSVDIFHSIGDGREALEAEIYDIALINSALFDATEDQLRDDLMRRNTSPPVVMLSSESDEKIALPSSYRRAFDCLLKSDVNPTLLRRICHHIIERKKQHVILEEKSSDQRAFCSSLSHDLKAPIRNIKMLCNMLGEGLAERVELTEEEREMFDLIIDKVSMMDELVANLRHYMLAEYIDGEFEDVDINLIMDDVVKFLDGHGLRDIDIAYENLPTILGSRSQLTLLFQIITHNAITYNEGSPIVEITSVSDANSTTISIKDNGIGIDAKFFELIFKPFQRLNPQSKYGGSGLGLSTVKRIVDRHHGSVSVTSTAGEGATFTLTFPNQPH